MTRPKLTYSPPPLAGTPKEAIKDSTPADLNADDDAEIEEAMETGSQKDQIMTQAKVKTKSHILGAFRSVGKKMAGFKGDVAIDGTRKQVSPSLADVWVSELTVAELARADREQD